MKDIMPLLVISPLLVIVIGAVVWFGIIMVGCIKRTWKEIDKNE
jgi:hypothetical protein